ncbi:helix-turn-helix transcriptional regulator [Raoultella planticola]
MDTKYKILRAREVMNMIGFRARSSFDYFYKDPGNHFPAPVNITKSRYGWVSSEVDAWLAERLEARNRVIQVKDS